MTIIRVKCPQCPQSRKYHGQSRRSCSPVATTATTATPACTTDHDSLSPPFIILHSFSLSINLFSSPPKSSWLPSIPNMLHTPIAIGMKWDQCHGLLCRLSYPIQEYIHTGTYRNIQVYSNSIHELCTGITVYPTNWREKINILWPGGSWTSHTIILWPTVGIWIWFKDIQGFTDHLTQRNENQTGQYSCATMICEVSRTGKGHTKRKNKYSMKNVSGAAAAAKESGVRSFRQQDSKSNRASKDQ